MSPNKESIGIYHFGPHNDKNLQVYNNSNHVEWVDDVLKLEHATYPLLLQCQRNHTAAIVIAVWQSRGIKNGAMYH